MGEARLRPWNKCNVCGRFVSYADIESGAARYEMVTPDTPFSWETWEMLCAEHNHRKAMGQQ